MLPDTDTNSGCGHVSGKGDKMARKQLVEIKNGRLAMLAITGYAFQEAKPEREGGRRTHSRATIWTATHVLPDLGAVGRARRRPDADPLHAAAGAV